MKKTVRIIATLTLVAALSVSLAACGNVAEKTAASADQASVKATESVAPSVSASTEASAATSESAPPAAEKPTLKLGSKDFTEGLLLSEIYALALEDNGFKVERKFNIGSSVIHQAIVSKELDLYPEYTGTSLLSILKLPLITDPKAVYEKVKEEYAKQFQLAVLNYSPLNDSNGLVINKAIADQYGIKTVSDLQKNADKIRFATQGEFEQREDGLPGLEKLYGPFKFKSISVFANALKYDVLANDQADLAVAYTTEGQLTDPKFLVLEDDKKFWPPYNIAPVVRQEVLDANPEIADILNGISAKIDTAGITKLNAEVDVNKREFEEVAKEFYDSIK